MRRIQFFLLTALAAAALTTACGDDPADVGESCSETADCVDGLVCVADTSADAEEGDKVCAEDQSSDKAKEGDACEKSDDCEGSLVCDDKVCAKDDAQVNECTFTLPSNDDAVSLCANELAKMDELKDDLQGMATQSALANNGLDYKDADDAGKAEILQNITCDLADKTGLSNECAYCTVIQVACGASYCASECAAGGDACDECLAENCVEAAQVSDRCIRGDQTPAPGEEGDACDAENVCADGLVCEEGVCAQDGGNDTPGEVGDACDDENVCADGLDCEEDVCVDNG